MSYVFTSPKYYVRQCPTDDDSLGFIGPDQPWSEATAGKEIVPATEDCHRGWQNMWSYEPDKPHYSVGYHKVKEGCSSSVPGRCRVDLAVRDYRFEDCFKTGRIDEAYKPGHARHEYWCCPPVPAMKPKRAVTDAEIERYGEDVCQPFYQGGEVYLGEPRWLDNNFINPTGWDFRETDIVDKGYRLYCYATKPEDYWKNLTVVGGGKSSVTIPAVDPAEMLRRREESAAEIEEVVRTSEEEFEYSFFERYGLYMAIGAGVIGIGLIAGLIKKSAS
jgi:hypothetical protein